MNTIQLIILWYGGLLVGVVLVYVALDRNGLGYGVTAPLVIVTALAVYTFSSHSKARKLRVAVFVLGGPLLGGALLYAWGKYSERDTISLIKPDQVEILDVGFTPQRASNPRFSGKIRNRSPFWLQQVEIELWSLKEGTWWSATALASVLRFHPAKHG